MPKVSFCDSGMTIAVESGTTLLQAARRLGLAVDAPCGGHGKCGKCRAVVNGQEALACQYTVDHDITASLPRQVSPRILRDGQTADLTLAPVKPGYLAAFDIGTTTVVCFLLSPDGKEAAAASMLNPQTPFGADVMTRIQYAIDGGLNTLTTLIRDGMGQLLEECCRKAVIVQEEIGVISVVGNPCMQQLFLGLPVNNLAEVPFAPVLTETDITDATAIFPKCKNAALLTVPDISGYIGADTMGCVLATRMYEAGDTVLMVDIGTNGEMVLAHKDRMTACSTAAGPALEGASIQYGMRGAEGAIDKVWLENGKIRCSVIGSGEAIGICGSGIIDAVAALLEVKWLNKRGRMKSTEEIDGQRIVKLTENVYLTQEDIRQVQLAKGAIAAGIQLMCGHLGITVEEIDRCILAGAFGSFLNPDSACRIGLLPVELSGKITAAGNLAGVGAKLLAMNKEQLSLSQSLLKRIEFLELAQVPSFQRTFALCMGFREEMCK